MKSPAALPARPRFAALHCPCRRGQALLRLAAPRSEAGANCYPGPPGAQQTHLRPTQFNSLSVMTVTLHHRRPPYTRIRTTVDDPTFEGERPCESNLYLWPWSSLWPLQLLHHRPQYPPPHGGAFQIALIEHGVCTVAHQFENIATMPTTMQITSITGKRNTQHAT